MSVELEKGKSYRLNNGWKMEVWKQHDVDRFSGKIIKYHEGVEGSVYDSNVSYNRAGVFIGRDSEYVLSVAGYWNEPSASGPTRDIDGWGLDEFRAAINKSGLFNW